MAKQNNLHTKEKAIVIDNVVSCKQCGRSKFASPNDYKQVKYNGESWTEFTVRCLDCDASNYYLAQLSLENTRRVAAEETNLEEIVDEE